MSEGQYSGARMDVESIPLLESSEIEVTRQTNAIEQLTLNAGFSGASKGAQKMMVKVTSGVPVAGLEYDAGPGMARGDFVSFTIYRDGGWFLTSKGILQEDVFKRGVSSAATYDFTILAKFAQWQQG